LDGVDCHAPVDVGVAGAGHVPQGIAGPHDPMGAALRVRRRKRYCRKRHNVRQSDPDGSRRQTDH